MKVVLFCGGFGMRMREYSDSIPKPMVTIGYRPILWHIMKIFSAYGVNDFIVCCGYKGYIIKEYFANYLLHNSNEVRGVRHIAIMHKKSDAFFVQIFIQMFDPFGIEQRAAAFDAVYLVTFAQQELGAGQRLGQDHSSLWTALSRHHGFGRTRLEGQAASPRDLVDDIKPHIVPGAVVS